MAFMSVLLEKYPDLFSWYSLRPTISEMDNSFEIPYAASRRFRWLTRFPQLKNMIQYFPWAWQQGRKAADFGRSHGIKVVLADLAFEAVIAGRVAAQTLGVPLLTMVHDDPINRLRVKHIPAWFLRWYTDQFARVLSLSRQTAVISDYMGEIYQERYGAKTVTLFPGVDPADCLLPRLLDSAKAPIVIGSVGSVTSVANWNILLDAVQQLNQRYGTGKFRILHLGVPPKNLPLSQDVEVTGWLPAKEFAHALGRIDVGFLTWDFSPELADIRRMSFPLKISSYLQAQVPMLALGTDDSTVVRFVRNYSCGTACTSPDAEVLAGHIESVVFGKNNYQTSLQGVIALKNIFSRAAFFERFEKFIQSSN